MSRLGSRSAALVAVALLVSACGEHAPTSLVPGAPQQAASVSGAGGEGAPPDAAGARGGSTASTGVGGDSGSAGSSLGAGGNGTPLASGGSPTSGGVDASGGSLTRAGAPPSGGSAGLDVAGTGGDASPGAGGAPEPGFMTVFNDTASCATCHGASGQGVATYGPDIRHPSRDLYLYMVRTGEPQQLVLYRKPMDAFDTTLVSDTDLEAIYDWLGGMPRPTTGAELFADYCSYCHGSDGRGGDKTIAYASAYHSAPYRRSGQEFLDYVRAGHVKDDQGVVVPVSDRHAYMPPFSPQELTDQEIQLIEAWLPKQ